MASGWYNEPRRHALSAKGIKTATGKKPIVTRSNNNNLYTLREWERKRIAGTTRLSLKDYSYQTGNFSLAEELEKLRLGKDTDNDGFPDTLDCDPKDPKKQGILDAIAIAVIANIIAKKISRTAKEREAATTNLYEIKKDLAAEEEKLQELKRQKRHHPFSRTKRKKYSSQIERKEERIDRLHEIIDNEILKRSKKED